MFMNQQFEKLLWLPWTSITLFNGHVTDSSVDLMGDMIYFTGTTVQRHEVGIPEDALPTETVDPRKL